MGKTQETFGSQPSVKNNFFKAEQAPKEILLLRGRDIPGYPKDSKSKEYVTIRYVPLW